MFENVEGNLIKIRAQHCRNLFPRSPIVLGEGTNTFGITIWFVSSVLDGHPVNSMGVEIDPQWGGEITVTGEFGSKIDDTKEYIILAKETEHPKYGKQYQLLYMNEDIDLKNVKGQRAFLKSFLSDLQIQELYKVFDNPLEVIDAHDTKELQKVKGIGPVLCEKICDRYEKAKDMSAIYIELDGMGLSSNLIQKLVARYQSPSKIIEMVKHNPYQLTYDVDGIGFLTADKIALSGGISPKSKKRIESYINYYLKEQGELGHSYVTASELLVNIYNELGGKNEVLEVYYDEEGNVTGNNVQSSIQDLIDKKILGMEDNENKAMRRVYLMKYYNLEMEIAFHLKRLLESKNFFSYDDWEEKVSEQEKKQGFEFTDEQKAGIKLGLDNQVCYITGPAGCVDCDTEFFNGEGWKKISEYIPGDKVLQWETTGKAKLVKPLAYIKSPCDYLYHFETKYGVNQTVCENHRIIYETPKGIFKETNILNIKQKQENPHSGWDGKFYTSFDFNGPGIKLTDEEIRFMVAVIADGSFTKSMTNLCRFHLKKERKKERIKKLAKDAGIELDERPSAAEGYNDYYCYAPLREKKFDKTWYRCSQHQLRIICDEVMFWEGNENYSKTGSIKRQKYSTTIKESADFIQFAFSATGSYNHKRASISIRNRKGQEYLTNNKIYTRKSEEYSVITTNRNLVGICADNRPNHTKTPIEKVSTKDGFKYCFTVPSGYLVLRRKNCIFVTGNCGKSSLVAGILSALNERYSFVQTALSGKAAANLQEITGETGMTIHRLLGYNPVDMGFMRNESNPLPYDIVILDELSLCGGSIFLDLIKAIPTGTKLICLGDQNQLEAIGALNLAADIYDSPIIPTVKLTKVHRQAQESGILTTSYLVKDQIQIHKENDYEGVEVRGNLQDMILDCKIDKDQTKDDVMAYFNKYYYNSEYRNNIMQIQILSPVKERGDACVDELNKAVQAEINPVNENDYHKPKILVKRKKDGNGKDRSFWIQKDDKVMCIKNNYKFFDVYENPVSIFNGWVGIVKDIDDMNVIVDFPLNSNPTLIPRKEVGAHLILGYASTIHKCVTGDSWIHTNQGLMQIQDVTADMIGELTVWNGKYFEKPDAFYVNPPMPVWEIETDGFHKYSGLPEHRVYVLGKNGKEVKQLKDLCLEDKLIYKPYLEENKYFGKERYENIISIKYKGYKSTYCFNMPETHDLVVNGFYGKNCQGSGFKVVIGALDYSTPPGMLTHQLVYTLLTRAKKECVLVAQTGALKKAIATDFVSTKRTFLKEFLDGRLKIKLPPKTKKRVQQQENEQVQEQIDNEEMGINNENGET